MQAQETDKYRIDQHKLIFHPHRVSSWLKGNSVYPIYMEVSPSGSCNHRCIYCGLDFMGYQPVFLETKLLAQRLGEMGKLGVKSIMYAGEGEPFLHKDMPQIAQATKKAGIDLAFTTNGVLLNQEISADILAFTSWIKVSINAASARTYEQVHRCRRGDFERVWENMAYAHKLRRRKGYKCTLGMQIVLLPENSGEVELLAKRAKGAGMDYLVVKPYSQHPQSKTRIFQDIKYKGYYDMAERLRRYNSKNFQVVFRINTMEKWDQRRRNYRHCLALPFWSYIDAQGNVWGCSIYLTKKKFCLGNIYQDCFKDIWETKKHSNLVRWAARELDTGRCRINCRMDEVNRYLWDLTHPAEHINFI